MFYKIKTKVRLFSKVGKLTNKYIHDRMNNILIHVFICIMIEIDNDLS